MSKDPAFLFYPNDYIGGTMGMTLEEKGAYIELLMMQFNRGHMTTHMIGQTIGHCWDTIKVKFMQDEDGLWYNKRLEIEQEKRKQFTESRRNNISGANQYTKKSKKKGGHTVGRMEDENVNKDIKKKEEDFEKFWDKYHEVTKKKKTDREATLKYWVKLTMSERGLAINNISNFYYSHDDKNPQFIKMARTYLSAKSFNNEFAKPKQKKPHQKTIPNPYEYE